MTPKTPKPDISCPYCEKAGTPDALKCASCEAPLHLACLNVSKPTAALKTIFTAPWFHAVCRNCLASKPGPGYATGKVTHPAPAQALLDSTLSKLETLSSSLQALVVGSEPLPSSYAEAAARGRRPPASNFATALIEAEKAKESEEKRLRSAVITGLPETDGVSDSEMVSDLLATAGVGGGCEIVETFRMGSSEPPKWFASARPDPNNPRRPPRSYVRKLKVVTKSPDQLAVLLSAAVRDASRNPTSAFANSYFAPSRTASERRYHALLRRRRWILNSAIPDPNDHWIIDSRRHVLVPRYNGRLDWTGPGDTGLVEWMKEEESKPNFAAAKPNSRRPSTSDNVGNGSRRGSLSGNY